MSVTFIPTFEMSCPPFGQYCTDSSVMLFLRALHPCYKTIIEQFASKQKDISVATLNYLISDVKYMDDLAFFGTNGKHNDFKIDEPNNQNHSNQVTISVPPPYAYGGIRRIRPEPLQTMASDANSPWTHLMKDTVSMANLTPHTPFPSGTQVTLPNSRFFLPTRSLQHGENSPTHANHLPVHLDKA